MSYIKDKEKMAAEAEQYRRSVQKLIKITFFALAVTLAVFCVALVGSLLFGKKSNDKTPPEIKGPSGGIYVGYVGDTPRYRNMVEVSDDSEGELDFDIDASAVDKDKEGSYKVYYTVTDEAGNSSKYTLTYVVKKAEYQEAVLMELIAQKAEELGMSKSMSKKELVRKIYSYVNSKSTIVFTDESNVPNINRANWGTDWVEEAIRVLDSGEGDCYSYYSLSKAFFEYFDIANKGIKRSTKSNEPGTHFWSAVEIEEGWYYYDSTRLGSTFADGTKNACLITEEKLQSYVTSEGGEEFYLMEKSASFPKISTKELS